MTQDFPLYDEVVTGFEELADKVSANETSDLRRIRKDAFENFRQSGFPTIRNEDWKYTNLTRFLKDEYALTIPTISAPTKLIDTARIAGFDCYTIVLVNGVWNRTLGSALPQAIELLPMAEAKQDPALAAWFSQEDNHRFFTALNTALFADGLFIRVKAGALPDKPLHIIHAYTSGTNLLVQPRHIWLVNERAECNIVESIVAGDGQSHIWANSHTEIVVHRDAKLDHAVIQNTPAGTRLVNHTTVRQKKQSLYNNYTFTLPGADLVRNDLQARLEEDHTETHLYGLYLAAGQQLVDNHTLVDHQKPNCFSNELYKGVLLEQSTGVFNGKVYVHQDAQKTNAFQQNNNLVIGKKATIDSKPELEIYADDVKCSHGSTVGQFSEEALFYLRARGIGEAAARALLINAFAFDVTEKIKHAAVETHINALISQHIPVTK
ncbi:MAG TPA: Fe-S cluster assembly protein SufD [Puia sp.]|nr:Fe-S cluster assembly protein SufD [Puia sp.]